MFFELHGCPVPPEPIVIEAPESTAAEEALDFVLHPLQPLREQFTAITGVGLETELPEGASPRREVLRDAEGRPILSYLAAGQANGRRVIFLHGSPGVAEEWMAFLTDVPAGRYHVAIDRPGFGLSPSEAPVVDLEAQARAVEPMLTSAKDGAVVVGYSYGGPVALRLAADYPEKVAGLLLIGSAADPALEEAHPLQEAAALDFFSEMLPAELANANAELLALKTGLEDLAAGLGEIRVPVTIVQGLEDTLVPPENVSYLQNMLPDTGVRRVILIEDADHFLPWTHVDLLKQALDCVVEEVFGQSSPPSSTRSR